MIRYFRNDFWRVRQALELIVGRRVPTGIVLVYYCVVLALVLPFAPFIFLIYHIWMRKLKKELEELQ